VVGQEGDSSSGHYHGDEMSDMDAMLPMTITEWLFVPGSDHATADPIGVAHLSISPMAPGANDLTVSLTDLEGNPLQGTDESSQLTLTYRALAEGATDQDIELTTSEDQPITWSADQVDLTDAGWYAFHIALDTGGDGAAAQLYALLPDPSVHGADAVELKDSNPDAVAVYNKALDTYATWSAAKWRESLGSGADALVVTRYALTSRPSEPAAQAMHSAYAASYRDQSDGTHPAAPQHDFAARVAIGDRMWSQTGHDTWEQVDGFDVASFADRAEIYEGATNIQLGGTDTVNGRDAQVITFFLPERDGQSEAWFAWWVDKETGDPLRIMMVAQMHFMIWDIYDINGSFSIDPPAAGEVATPAAD
jgi:hypothetical protein